MLLVFRRSGFRCGNWSIVFLIFCPNLVLAAHNCNDVGEEKKVSTMCGVVRYILIYGLQFCMHTNASSVLQKKLKEVIGVQMHDNLFQRTKHSLLSFFVMLQSQAFIRSEECRQLFHLPPEEVSGVVILLRESFDFLRSNFLVHLILLYLMLKEIELLYENTVLDPVSWVLNNFYALWWNLNFKKDALWVCCYPPDNRWFECFVWVAGGYFPAM